MKILRSRIKFYSAKSDIMFSNIEKELKRQRVEDFDIEENIPSDSCSLEIDINGLLTINVPDRFDFFRYEVEDYIRSKYPYQYITTDIDRDLYRLKLSMPLKESGIIDLIKYIIGEQDFCTLIK